jgi:hypothetical protein
MDFPYKIDISVYTPESYFKKIKGFIQPLDINGNHFITCIVKFDMKYLEINPKHYKYHVVFIDSFHNETSSFKNKFDSGLKKNIYLLDKIKNNVEELFINLNKNKEEEDKYTLEFVDLKKYIKEGKYYPGLTDTEEENKQYDDVGLTQDKNYLAFNKQSNT